MRRAGPNLSWHDSASAWRRWTTLSRGASDLLLPDQSELVGIILRLGDDFVTVFSCEAAKVYRDAQTKTVAAIADEPCISRRTCSKLATSCKALARMHL